MTISEAADAATDARRALEARMRTQIEALCEGRVEYSRTAMTARLTQHKQFVNGAEKAEMEVAAKHGGRPVEELVDATIHAVKSYRASIDGPVNLVWRIEPEISEDADGPRVYVRLCFEPVIVNLAPGVWVEKRITEGDWR